MIAVARVMLTELRFEASLQGSIICRFLLFPKHVLLEENEMYEGIYRTRTLFGRTEVVGWIVKV